jgi:hypothetical protein
MTFSKKAGTTQQGNTTVTKEELDAKSGWHQYQFDTFKAKAKELPNGKTRKEKSLIGRVNLIMDLGFPPSAPSEWETKCSLPSADEEYSQEEIRWMEKNPSHDFIWTKEYDESVKKSVTVRKQTSPSYPAQEYGVAVDFPQIMLDYSKHPESTSDKEDLRPLRISLNGSFHQKFFKTIVFDGSFKPVSSNNLLYKICTAADLEKELIESQFDIATVAGATCNFTVRADLNTSDDGVTYINWNASKPASVDDIETPEGEWSAEDQIEKAFEGKNVSEFVGILLDGQDYTDDMLTMLGNDTFGYVKHASESATFLIEGVSKKTGNPYSFEKGLDYGNTDFAKAWKAFREKNGETVEQSQPVKKESPPKKESLVENKPIEKPFVPEDDMDFDENIPF